MALIRKLTAEEFLARGHEWPRGTQLIRGEVVVNQPAWLHQRVLGQLFVLLRAWCDARSGRGEVGLSLDLPISEHDVYAPDLWWRREDRRLDRGARRLPDPPDLVIEVRSPATWRFDISVKVDAYETGGVAEVWLVDTASESVIAFRRSSSGEAGFDVVAELAGDDELVSPLLPGFSVAVRDVFAG